MYFRTADEVLLLSAFTINTVVAQYSESVNPPPNENPCNLVDCIPNTRCIVENGVPKCLELGKFIGSTLSLLGFLNNAVVIFQYWLVKQIGKQKPFPKKQLVPPTTQHVLPMRNTTRVARHANHHVGIQIRESVPSSVSSDVNARKDSTVMMRMSVWLAASGELLPLMFGLALLGDFEWKELQKCSNLIGPGGCGVNEERKSCGTACEPTCSQPNPIRLFFAHLVTLAFLKFSELLISTEKASLTIQLNIQCTRQCVSNVCQCRRLYIRDSNNACVHVAACPTEPVKPCSELNCPRGTRCELGRIICPFVPPCFTQQTRCVPTNSPPAPPPAGQGPRPALPPTGQGLRPTPPATNTDVVTVMSADRTPSTVFELLVLNLGRDASQREALPVKLVLPMKNTRRVALRVNHLVVILGRKFVPNNVSWDVNADRDSTVMLKMSVCLTALVVGPTLPLCSSINCPPRTMCLIPCRPDNDSYATPPPSNLKVSNGLTCANVRCRDGYVCRLETVNCVRAPCPPRPICVPTESPPLTCDNVRCPAGTECQQVPLNCFVPPCPQPPPQCVKIEQYNPCAATTCPVGSDCVVRQVVCVRAPCNPVGECVPQSQPDRRCGQFESFQSCASNCEPSCSNRNPTCILSCAPPKCQCNTGFYRNDSGSCVTAADCDAAGNTNPY
ncbi:trypsin Inhibitor like cysteine rich domain protein [Cooperia oncophora]